MSLSTDQLLALAQASAAQAQSAMLTVLSRASAIAAQEGANAIAIAAEVARAAAAETALYAAVSAVEPNTLFPLVDAYKQSGDPDDTAAFARGLAANFRLYGAPGKIYVVNGVVLDGRQFYGNGCVVRDAVGAPYCFRLQGYNPELRNVQFQDQGHVAKVTTNSGGFASGATSFDVVNPVGIAAGQIALVQGNNPYWEHSLVAALSGSTVTLRDVTDEAGSSGLPIVASFGLVHIDASDLARVSDLVFENAYVGIVMSPTGAGSEVSRPILSNLSFVGARYCAFAKYGDSHDVQMNNLVAFGGAVDTFSYIGGGIAGAFGVGYAVDLTRDLTVTLNGVAQVYGTHFALSDSYTIAFLSGHYPPTGSAIRIDHYHAGVRGFIEDQRGTVVAGGNQFSAFKLLKFWIAVELQSVQLADYQQIVGDTNQYVGLFLNNCGFDCNFAQSSFTWARQPIFVYRSSRVAFDNLVTTITPSADINPFIALGDYEITADALSIVDVDLSQWSSQTYLYAPAGNVNLYGGQQRLFASATPLAAGASTFLNSAGQASVYTPADIADRNAFVVGFYAAVNVAPGAGEQVTFNLIRNPDASPVTIASLSISGAAAFGGFLTFASVAIALGDRLGVQAVYSAGAASSYPRGFFLRR